MSILNRMSSRVPVFESGHAMCNMIARCTNVRARDKSARSPSRPKPRLRVNVHISGNITAQERQHHGHIKAKPNSKKQMHDLIERGVIYYSVVNQIMIFVL